MVHHYTVERRLPDYMEGIQLPMERELVVGRIGKVRVCSTRNLIQYRDGRKAPMGNTTWMAELPEWWP